MAVANVDQITTLTFDCYGTLIDYEAGTLAALRPLLDRHNVALSDDAPIGPTRPCCGQSWTAWEFGSASS